MKPGAKRRRSKLQIQDDKLAERLREQEIAEKMAKFQRQDQELAQMR
jgi:hypothetical protein